MAKIILGAGRWKIYTWSYRRGYTNKMFISGGTDADGTHSYTFYPEFSASVLPGDLFVYAPKQWEIVPATQTGEEFIAVKEGPKITDAQGNITSLIVYAGYSGEYPEGVLKIKADRIAPITTAVTPGTSLPYPSWTCLSLINTTTRFIILQDQDGVIRKHPITDTVYIELVKRFSEFGTCTPVEQNVLDLYPTGFEITMERLSQWPFAPLTAGGTEIYVGPERIPFPKELLPPMVPAPVYPTPSGVPGMPSTAAYEWLQQPQTYEPPGILDQTKQFISNYWKYGAIGLAAYWFVFKRKKGKLL